jgi:hypothetical protein
MPPDATALSVEVAERPRIMEAQIATRGDGSADVVSSGRHGFFIRAYALDARNRSSSGAAAELEDTQDTVPTHHGRGGILPTVSKGRIMGLLAALPMLHRDPFDRILIAQAIAEGLELVTNDGPIRGYPVRTTW